MNAWIKFYYCTGIPIVSIAVLAEVIFFCSKWFLVSNSFTRTANSPNRLARMMAPKPLKKVPKAI